MPIYYFVSYFVSSIIGLLQVLLFARAILSWFPQMQGSQIANFLYMTTEPIILPFRKFLSNIEALRSVPMDFSLLLAFFVLEFLRIII